MIDLHTHSTASDGSFTPQQLVINASDAGISHLALTDHDSVDGIAEARLAATENGINLIDGIELSVRWQSKTLHIVGLGINPECPVLTRVIETAQQIRINRGRAIGEKLEMAGVEDAYKKTCEIAGSALVGRSHFARMLVAAGHAKDIKQVFKRFMVRGKPGYASAEWIELAPAINAIHDAGGVAIVAHPMRYNLSRRQLEHLLADFKQAGGDAMEVISGRSTKNETELMSRLANQFELAASTGSDFHGPDKPWLKLGCLVRLPANCTPIWQKARLW